MGQLFNSSTPEQVRKRVEVPDIELVVQRTTEAHPNEVWGEQDQNYLWFYVKVWYTKQEIHPDQYPEYIITKYIL